MLARRVMEESEHVLLVGMGAARFARVHGIPACRKDDLIVDREISRWRDMQRTKRLSIRDLFRSARVPGDTVGAVAMDRAGNLASATSTGGLPHKHPGRVGDSPLIGCGTYADNQAGAVSVTGWGEAIIRVVLAKSVSDMMEHTGLNAGEAATRGIELLNAKVGGYGGLIVLDREGRVGIDFNTPKMARGFISEEHTEPRVFV